MSVLSPQQRNDVMSFREGKPIFSLRIPGKPVSTNHAYPSNSQGRRYLSQEGRAYKEMIAQTASYVYSGDIITYGDLKVYISYHFADNRVRDVNNYDKIIVDALTGIIYEDDKLITEIQYRKDQTGDRDFTDIVVCV